MKNSIFATTLFVTAALSVTIGADIALGADFSKPDTYFNFAKAGETASTFQLPGIAKVDPRAVIVNVISIAAGFLGIIAVVIILISGFQWMTAGGDDDAVKKAQTRLMQGVIGLILVLSTWSIAYYVVAALGANVFKESQE